MNLIEGLQSELKRCRELLKAYDSIGPAGKYGAAYLKRDIKTAEDAISNGDTVAMLRNYKTLKGCK